MTQHCLSYTIVVMGPAYGTQSSFCAYQFCQALVNSPHRIETIFFYGDGIYNANCYTSPAGDEFDLVKRWQSLAQKHDIKLEVCISAAARRGVVDDEQSNLASGFELVGLGALSEALAHSDRVMQF